jgi:DNA polymerase-3 subunit delta'
LHPDVHWLRAESKLRLIRVEQVRSLTHAIQLKPAEARFKVGILMGADRLSPEAANAFLKTLEEPPPQSLLILLSTEPERVIETILSRCLRLSIPAPEALDETQLEWLQEFAGALQSAPASLLTRYRLLDILSRRLTEIRKGVETNVEARSPAAEFRDADPALREDWEAEAKAAVEAEFRRLRAQTLQCLQLWLRDLWLMTLGQPVHLLAIPGLRAASQAVAARLDPPRALANLNLIEDTQRLLHTNIQEGLPLEVALLRLNM